MLTVTNTNTSDVIDPLTNLPLGTVELHFIYVGRFGPGGTLLNCNEDNFFRTLTPGDTFTFLTRSHNPNTEQGFMFCYARHPTTHRPTDFDFLIGNGLFINGIEAIDYSTNPISLECKAGPGDADLDGDGELDLDGFEYEKLPDEILIPRYLATVGSVRSQLILLGLSGGAAFETNVQLYFYNDNEELFSAQRQFRCWERVALDDISSIFLNTYLKTTGHDPSEPFGATTRESGWIQLFGDTAFSSAEQIDDPAVYAVLVEKTGRAAGAADLPFEVGYQNNGDLWRTHPWGDGAPWDGY